MARRDRYEPRRRHAPYDRDIYSYPVPAPWIGYHPVTYRGGGAIYGLEGGGWAPFDPDVGPDTFAYEGDYDPRVSPRESATFGRRGDRAVRHWAGEHGYRTEKVIHPRRPRRPRPYRYERREGWRH